MADINPGNPAMHELSCKGKQASVTLIKVEKGWREKGGGNYRDLDVVETSNKCKSSDTCIYVTATL